jgi:hypothetical protein
MPCSYCGQSGHNKSTCPVSSSNQSSNQLDKALPDRALIARFDNLTEEEQNQMHLAIKEAKRKIAPDSRVTLVEGKANELPTKIRALIEEG